MFMLVNVVMLVLCSMLGRFCCRYDSIWLMVDDM